MSSENISNDDMLAIFPARQDAPLRTVHCIVVLHVDDSHPEDSILATTG